MTTRISTTDDGTQPHFHVRGPRVTDTAAVAFTNAIKHVGKTDPTTAFWAWVNYYFSDHAFPTMEDEQVDDLNAAGIYAAVQLGNEGARTACAQSRLQTPPMIPPTLTAAEFGFTGFTVDQMLAIIIEGAEGQIA